MGALALLIILAILVYLGNIAWRATETTLQGVVSGVRLFWHGAWAVLAISLRFYVWTLRWAHVLQLELSQRLHAAWWCYSYRWRRAYIAHRLREERRSGRQAH